MLTFSEIAREKMIRVGDIRRQERVPTQTFEVVRVDADVARHEDGSELRRNPLLAPYVAYSPPFGASTSTSIVASRGSASSSKAGLGDIEHDNKNRGDGNFDEDERPAKRKKVASPSEIRRKPQRERGVPTLETSFSSSWTWLVSR
jgi:hypothetical protein